MSFTFLVVPAAFVVVAFIVKNLPEIFKDEGEGGPTLAEVLIALKNPPKPVPAAPKVEPNKGPAMVEAMLASKRAARKAQAELQA